MDYDYRKTSSYGAKIPPYHLSSSSQPMYGPLQPLSSLYSKSTRSNVGRSSVSRRWTSPSLSSGFGIQVSIEAEYRITLPAIILRSYPCQLSLTAMICFWGMVEGAILAFVVERGHSGVWSIQFNIKLVAAFYGAMQSVVAYYVMGMVVKEKGPVFYSAFNPLATVMVAILGSFVLAEQLYLESVIGAAVIIIGLYLILWGKAKDQSPPSQC